MNIQTPFNKVTILMFNFINPPKQHIVYTNVLLSTVALHNLHISFSSDLEVHNAKVTRLILHFTHIFSTPVVHYIRIHM